MKNDLPLVSIIIVNLNGKSHLEKCLESLLEINYSNYEIIVVDNHSTDGSIEFLEKNYPQITIKKLKKNYGFANPNNLGAKLANGEFLLFLNNDTIVDSNFISELIKIITSKPENLICQSHIKNMNGNIDSSGDFIDENGIPFSSKLVYSEPTEILSPRGASFMISKKLFLSLEGFDEKFFASFEDVDLGIRAWLSGIQIFAVPKSIVFHLGGATISKNRSLSQYHGVKNWMIILLTYFDFITRSKIFIKNFLIFFKNSFKSQSHNSTNQTLFPSFKTILKSIWWISINRNYVKNKKRKINHNKKISIKLLIEKGLVFKSNI